MQLLGGCATPQPAPVVDRSTTPGRTPATHQVVSGETLYSIAFRYGLDYRSIAAENGIPSPYLIHVGQQLRLPGSRPASSRQASRRPSAVTSGAESGRTPESRPLQPGPVEEKSRSAVGEGRVESERKPQAGGRGVPPPASDKQTSNRRAATTPLPAVPSLPRRSATESRKVAGLEWLWPNDGPLAGTFRKGGSRRRGIEIVGGAGTPVVAAEGGEVVYSGNGLQRYYGNLIIIRHNDRYLSAYAHNDRLLVKEGAKVSRGQRIATLGSTGSDRPKLHFEIRRDGKPVDPLSYLPRR